MCGLFKAAATICMIAVVTPAFAQNFSSDELDRMSQERQQDIGSRDWGNPVNPTPQTTTSRPLPLSVTCMSATNDTATLYSAPNIHVQKVGIAGPQLAVTNTEVSGWRMVLMNANHMAWIQASELGPYQSLNASHPVDCVVSGERADGTVLFAHPDQ